MRERVRERAEARGAVFSDRGYGGRGLNMVHIIALLVAVIVIVGGAVWLRNDSLRSSSMGPMMVSVIEESASKGHEAIERVMPPPSEDAFPESGTVEWGDEGQPIGGNLERLEIWDVTQSPQNKVIRIRSGPDTVFATIYVTAAKRFSIMVPSSRAYQVTATSGTTWHGPARHFGDGATTVDFGMVNIYRGRPGVVAMGAPDQQASIVGNDRF